MTFPANRAEYEATKDRARPPASSTISSKLPIENGRLANCSCAQSLTFGSTSSERNCPTTETASIVKTGTSQAIGANNKNRHQNQ